MFPSRTSDVSSVIPRKTRPSRTRTTRELPLPLYVSIDTLTILPSVFHAKRLIGRKFSDAEVQSDMKHFPFKVIDKGGKPYIRVQYRGEDKEFVGWIVSEPYRVFNLVSISLPKKSPPWS